ncbi:MAG: DNA ligase [Pseudomonadota bacterium]
MRVLFRGPTRWLVAVAALWLTAVSHAAPPQLTLAEVYEPGIALEDYWVSEKYDGVRAYWDGNRFLSRQGNVFRAPERFTRGLPREPLDGELWMGRGRFDELSGAVRRLEPDDRQWRQIRFMVFDLPASDRPFTERIGQIRNLLDESSSPFVRAVPQWRVSGHAGLMAELDAVVAKGGEGLMLRHGASGRESGRTDSLLKVKRHDDGEAVVVGHLPGNGKYQGALGALRVQLADGRRFRLGSGLSDAERLDPPPIGSVVTYKHFGLTSTGLPRFASFLRVRADEPPSGTARSD